MTFHEPTFQVHPTSKHWLCRNDGETYLLSESLDLGLGRVKMVLIWMLVIILLSIFIKNISPSANYSIRKG